MIKSEQLAPIDHFFAERLLSRYSDSTEKEKSLLANLMCAARQGHLCLNLKEDAASLKLKNPKELHFYNGYLYLQKNWLLESRFLQHIRRLQGTAEQVALQSEGLTEEQAEAGRRALSSNLTLITGGPGTGKTYTAAKIAQSFLTTNKRVVLAAPTGKAATQLEVGIRRHIGDNPLVKCGTLHALLNCGPKTDFFEENAFLPADLVIVDECSMIDARLFAYFLSALKTGTRLILMGDPDQLPPVEAGSLFADLVEAAHAGYSIPCAVLNRSIRSENRELLGLAQAIRSGNVEAALPLIRRCSVKCDLWEKVKSYFPLPSEQLPDPQELLQQMNSFRILSTMRVGPLGVNALNDSFVERFKQAMKPGHWWAAPILIERNDYELGLNNGETGILIHRSGKAEYALFTNGHSISAALLPSFAYGYCLSVHKSQGSEYQNVLLLIPPGSEVFGREVLYTAITRAKQQIEIEGSDDDIRLAIQRSSRKISALRERLISNPMGS